MKKTVQERLALIKQGLLIEAMTDDDTGIDDTSGTEPDGTGGDDTGDDSGDYNLPDDDTGDTGSDDDTADDAGDEPATTDNTDGTTDDNTETEKPKDGEFLPIDESARKILAYRNFQKYRDLEDDVKNILTSLTEMPTFNAVNTSILKVAIEKCSDLHSKLEDYILYKYKNTSYEINYKNFADFIIEKKLVEDLVNTIVAADPNQEV